MTWTPETEIWICSECGTLYNLPDDEDDLACFACCVLMRGLDEELHRQQEVEDDADDAFWRED